MAQYPTLSEMGIQTLDDIYKYTLRREGDQDVLKIYFKREKGSLLSRSKKFKFGRSTRTVRVDSSQHKYEDVSEMSPFLMKAIDELHQLVQKEHEREITKDRLLEDLDHLEKVMQNKLDELRRDLKQLK